MGLHFIFILLFVKRGKIPHSQTFSLIANIPLLLNITQNIWHSKCFAFKGKRTLIYEMLNIA